MHICLIDDDARLLSTLQRGLVESGHECEVFSSSARGLERLLDQAQPEPDLLLLDVMMPEPSGWEVLKQLRDAGLRTPAIFLTARQDVADRIMGLELGADDYVVKPFAFAELLARIQAVLRRHGYRQPLEVGPMTVNRQRQRVVVEGRQLDLTPREYAFLELLAESRGRVFTRKELLQELWGIGFDPGTNIVDVLVARLRRKLGPTIGAWIETVVGEGYRLRETEPA